MLEAETRRFEHEARFVKFGEDLVASLAAPSAPGMRLKVIRTFTQDPEGSHCHETLGIIKKMPLKLKTEDVRVIELRCHELLRDPMSTLAVANEMIFSEEYCDPWLNFDFRMSKYSRLYVSLLHTALTPLLH